MMFKNSKFWERMFQKPLDPTARTSNDCSQTWRRRGQAATLHSASSKGSSKSEL